MIKKLPWAHPQLWCLGLFFLALDFVHTSPLPYLRIFHYSIIPLFGNSPNMIISILSPKGGAGKSTLCSNLARAFQLSGHNVLIIDTDPQGTLSDWLEQQDEQSDQPAVVTIDNARSMRQQLPTVAKVYDTILLDGALSRYRNYRPHVFPCLIWLSSLADLLRLISGEQLRSLRI